jgi:hypothetical protein
MAGEMPLLSTAAVWSGKGAEEGRESKKWRGEDREDKGKS